MSLKKTKFSKLRQNIQLLPIGLGINKKTQELQIPLVRQQFYIDSDFETKGIPDFLNNYGQYFNLDRIDLRNNFQYIIYNPTRSSIKKNEVYKVLNLNMERYNNKMECEDLDGNIIEKCPNINKLSKSFILSEEQFNYIKDYFEQPVVLKIKSERNITSKSVEITGYKKTENNLVISKKGMVLVPLYTALNTPFQYINGKFETLNIYGQKIEKVKYISFKPNLNIMRQSNIFEVIEMKQYSSQYENYFSLKLRNPFTQKIEKKSNVSFDNIFHSYILSKDEYEECLELLLKDRLLLRTKYYN